MACLEMASPALKEILLKLYHSKRSTEIDHHLYEFGSVEYHIQSSATDEHHAYLSISTPLLSQEVLLPYGISQLTKQMITGICSDVVEITEPAKEGYQLTLRVDFSKLASRKDSLKVITEISSVQAIILSTRLKEVLANVDSHETFQGLYKPIKLVYRPSEPFFIIRQPHKTIAVFPIHFKDKPDIIIATTFFQELMDVGSSEKWAKAPPCSWSPIPPPELRGEPFEDLSTTGGFVLFEISSRHVKGKRLDKTAWSLLNFYAYVRFHVKSTRSFIQRRMRKRLDGLVELLHKRDINLEDEDDESQSHKSREFKCKIRIANLPKPTALRRKYKQFGRTIKRIRSRIKINGFRRFHHRWLKMPKFSSSTGYMKLE